MKWIHISDLHIDPQGDGTNTEILRKKLKNYINNHHITADYLFVTGDYRNAKYPRKDIENLVNAAADFIIDIARAAKVELANIHFVPGNHDLNRTKDVKRIELIKENYNGKFEPEDLEFLLERFAFFNLLCRELTKRGVNSPWSDTLQPLHPYLCLKDFSLLYLNTCVICNSDTDRHDLIIGNYDLYQSLEKIDKENPNKPIIILAHHGLAYLHDDENREVANILSNYPVKLYLCGDTHKLRIRTENKILEITMGCSVSEIGSTAVFSVGEMENDNFSAKAYRWNEDFNEWEPLTSFNDYFQESPTEVITKMVPISPKENFIGRSAELNKVKKAVDDNNKIILLYGMGGIGKTELCRLVFQQHLTMAGKIRKIGWIIYRNTIKDSFWNQFPVIETKEKPDEIKNETFQKKLISLHPECGKIPDAEAYWLMVRKYIHRHGQELLLIIDNANEITNPEILLLNQLDCKIILTSRKQIENVKCINMPRLEQEECLNLYRIHSQDQTADDTTIENIVSLVSGHTLLIELLAKLQYAAGLTAEELYKKLKEEGFDLSDITENISYLHNPEFNSPDSWDNRITEHIKKLLNISDICQNDEKMQIMRFFSILSPNCVIAIQTVKKWMNLPNLNTVNALADGGWLTRSTQNGIPALTMHPLIYIGICDMMAPNEKLETLWVKNAAEDIRIRENETAGSKANVLIPAEALINNIHIRNAEYVDLLGSFLGIYIADGKYQTAKESYEEVLNAAKELFGSRHVYIAKIYNTFGAIYDGLAQYDDALEYYIKGAEMHEDILGDNHLDTAVSFCNVASVYLKLNILEKAQTQISRACIALESHPDKEYSSEAAIIYITLGNYYMREVDLDTSITHLKKALEIYKKTAGEEHPNTMAIYGNIAAIYHAQGKCTEALDIYHHVRKVYEKKLGEKHQNTTAIYRNIGNVYRTQKNYGEALKWYEKTAKIREEIYGKNHILTGYVYNDIGIIHFYQNKCIEALKDFYKALPIHINALGEENDNTKWVYFNIRTVYINIIELLILVFIIIIIIYNFLTQM